MTAQKNITDIKLSHFSSALYSQRSHLKYIKYLIFWFLNCDPVYTDGEFYFGWFLSFGLLDLFVKLHLSDGLLHDICTFRLLNFHITQKLHTLKHNDRALWKWFYSHSNSSCTYWNTLKKKWSLNACRKSIVTF